MTRMTGSVPEGRRTTRPSSPRRRPPSARCPRLRERSSGRISRHFHIDHGLREARHARRELCQALPRFAHDREHLQPGHERVASRGLVQQQDVARGLATQRYRRIRAACQDIAIADLRAFELDALLAQRHFESEVAHHRPDHRTLQRSGALARSRDDVDELVAIDDAAKAIDHDEPIAVAVERDARGGAHAGNGELQEAGRGRAAAVIDVAAVRRAADRNDFRAEIGERARHHFVAGAVGAIDDELHALERHALGQRLGAEVLIVAARLVDARGAAQVHRRTRDRAAVELGLDGFFDFIGKLAAVGVEELDAVVVIQIVRRADDDAEVAIELAREIGDARSGQRPDQHDVDARGDEARLERGLEHVSRQPSVLADEHGAAIGAPARGLRRSRGAVRNPPSSDVRRPDHERRRCRNTYVPSKFSPCATAAATRIASTVAATSWARTIRAPLRTAMAANATLPAVRSSTARPVSVRAWTCATGPPPAARRARQARRDV